MVRSSRAGTCVYCGAYGIVTSDHVPPKCLFPPETRVNLITVHACQTCHESYKLDDEYFRVILSFRDDLPDGPEAQFLRDQTQKTLNKPAALAFRYAIERSIIKIDRQSPDGISQVAALKIDPLRIKRTANRIVRGLYGNFFGLPLPKSYELSVSLFDFQKDMSALNSAEVQELLGLLYQHGNNLSFGKVFDIWYAKTDDDAYSSLWFLRVHGAFGLIGFTVPDNERLGSG